MSEDFKNGMKAAAAFLREGWDKQLAPLNDGRRISDVILCKFNLDRRLRAPRRVKHERSQLETDAWTRGYAAAVAAVQRLYGEHTIAKQVMIADGMTPEKLAASGVESFDMKEIRKLWKWG